MKNCLRATTILAGALIAGHAMAQTAGPKAPFSAFIDGDVQGYIGIGSGATNNGTTGSVNNTTANSHGRALGMVQNAEIRWTFQGKADNGLTYGFYDKMGAASSSITVSGFQNDREDLFIRHPSYGTLQIGNNSSAGKGAFPYTQCDYGPLLNVNSLCADGGSEQLFITDPNAIAIDAITTKLGADMISRGRGMGIFYASPRINGFDFVFDYGPDGASRNEENFVTTTSATVQTIATKSTSKLQNIGAAALHYTWAAGDWSGKLGAGLDFGEGKYVYTPTGQTKAISDLFGGILGMSAQWRDIRFAAMYSWKGRSMQLENPTAVNPTGPVNTNHPTAWGYSLLLERYSYAIYQPNDKGPSGGDWGYGIYYQFGRDAGPFTNNGIYEMNYFGVGGGYWLAPGLQLFGEAFYYDDYNTHIRSQDAAAGIVTAGGGFAAGGIAKNQRNPHGQVYFMGLTVEW